MTKKPIFERPSGDPHLGLQSLESAVVLPETFLLMFPRTAEHRRKVTLSQDTQLTLIVCLPPVLFWSFFAGTDRASGCELLTHHGIADGRGGEAAHVPQNWNISRSASQSTHAGTEKYQLILIRFVLRHQVHTCTQTPGQLLATSEH